LKIKKLQGQKPMYHNIDHFDMATMISGEDYISLWMWFLEEEKSDDKNSINLDGASKHTLKKMKIHL
jgi:hypothetical protein